MERNYRLYLIASSITSFAGGIFGPFYVLFIQQKGGGIENFGIAMGIFALVQSIFFYLAGKYSDIFGRKPLFIIEGYISVLVFLLYLMIDNIWQLYLLQMINGLLSGIHGTTEVAFLGDITNTEKRGKDIGKYHAITGAIAALAMMGSGYIVGKIGIQIIFIFAALASLISTTILLFLKEKR